MTPRGIFEGPRSTPSQPPYPRTTCAPHRVSKPLWAPARAHDAFSMEPRPVPCARPTRAALGTESESGRRALRRRWRKVCFTPLQSAIVDNDVTQVRALLNTGKCNLEERDNMGHTALHVAAALNSEKFVELLLAHGANREANDALGLTPLYVAASFKAYGTLEILLEESRAGAVPTAPWYDLRYLGAVCANLRAGHVNAPSLDSAGIDALLTRMVGLHEDKLQHLGSLKQMLLYHAHLLSLTGESLDLDLEGWVEIDMLLQRTRSLLRIAAMPPPLPEGVPPAALGATIVYALRCDLEQIRLMHRLMVLENMPTGNRRWQLLQQEAQRIASSVRAWPMGEEFSIPTGFSDHACYVCFSRRIVAGQEVITLRMDNLGSTQRASQFTGSDGRIAPLSFNIPLAFLNTPSGDEMFTRSIERLVASRTDRDAHDHSLNSSVYTLLRQVKRHAPTALVDDTPFTHPDFHHKPQSVGNCVLKNHSAGLCGRMGRVVFRWFKRCEVSDVEARLSHAMAPGTLRACEEEKWRTQWSELLNEKPLGMDLVHAFFDKPGREAVLWGMDDKTWRALIAHNDDELLALALARGAQLPDITHRQSTPLHWAVTAKAPEILLALLRASAPVNAVDDRGRTALHLAVRSHNTRAVNILLAWGADGSLADDRRESPESIGRARAQRASLMACNLQKASTHRESDSSDGDKPRVRIRHDASMPQQWLNHLRKNEPPAPG